eukprot:scaffold438_cov250-Pinguiococcus_pyrenoidosus.AAC.38
MAAEMICLTFRGGVTAIQNSRGPAPDGRGECVSPNAAKQTQATSPTGVKKVARCIRCFASPMVWLEGRQAAVSFEARGLPASLLPRSFPTCYPCRLWVRDAYRAAHLLLPLPALALAPPSLCCLRSPCWTGSTSALAARSRRRLVVQVRYAASAIVPHQLGIFKHGIQTLLE